VSDLPTQRSAKRPAASATLAALVRVWGSTWRLRRPDGDQASTSGPAVLVGWHGEQLGLLVAHRHVQMRVLVSRSRDGELAAGTLRRLGVGAVRGSTSSGGLAALREGVRSLESGVSVAVLADGPRGPRHHAAPGAAALSSLSGRPLVCLRASPSRAIRLGSWDRFEIPLPFTAITVYAKVLPPVGRGRSEVEAGRQAIEVAMRR
jgi:lysophospholipid acyltransferase (LPLAT)-like uncharacterized protein